MELRKINTQDAFSQWEYTTALPADENGLTNPYHGVSYEEYLEKVLPVLISYEHPLDMPEWFVPETYYCTEGLRLTVQIAKNIVPEDEIYLRVNKDNIASQKVMLKNGARLAGEDEKHLFMRIKI